MTLSYIYIYIERESFTQTYTTTKLQNPPQLILNKMLLCKNQQSIKLCLQTEIRHISSLETATFQ